MSVDYYNQHAQQFIVDTLEVDMAPLYTRFLPLLPDGAHILDAGCGAGRDAGHFLKLGFRVSAMDASEVLAREVTARFGIPVTVCRFHEYQSAEPFDAIWACASLLHVPGSELTQVMAHLAGLLKPGGLFYCSFKYGQGELERGGRRFTNLDEAGLAELVASLPLTIHNQWQTGDLRPGREQERWLNAVLRKS